MKAVIVDRGVLEGEPICAVSYLEPEHHWDSGYALFAGPPDPTDEGGLLCVDCLLDLDIAPGLALAREHGAAVRDGDKWTAGDQPGPACGNVTRR
ncbi:MAG TPA: hypothetical protein VF025_11455 [Gaiellaceae bacterium]